MFPPKVLFREGATVQTNVVRQPIMSATKELLGYELLYQENSSSLYNQGDTVAANTIESFLTQLDSDVFMNSKTAFVPFTPNLLLRRVPRMFNPQSLVIEIDDSSVIHPDTQREVVDLKRAGYKMALKGFEFSPRFFALLGEAEYLKIDMANVDETTASSVDIARSFGKKVIAYHVDDQNRYDRAKAMGCEYFQGSAVSQAFNSKVNRLDHLQSNFFQLMVAVTRDEPDVEEITSIISRDVTLAFSLIKLVNSAYFALRNRVRSVKQALVVLGLGQLKQWVYLLSFKQNNNDLDTELIKTSFLRGSFCSELSQFASKLDLARSDAYLMGMFSTLGILLEIPLERALNELPIIDEIKDALIEKKGPAGTLYRLVLAYENANWHEVFACADELGLERSIVGQKYLECMDSVTAVWNSLQKPMASIDENEVEA